MLFHAQFSVRIVPWDEPLHLQSFAAGTRVAHTARKNLLMASVRDLGNAAGEEEVVFFSVVPDISQSSNKKLFSGQQRQ
jgi:tRNA splicing endonuclease